jgi:hypothetical protein
MRATGKMPVLRQISAVNICVVIERDSVVLGEALEDSAQFAKHGTVVRMIRGGDVRAAEEAAFEAGIVKDLLIGQSVMLKC